MKIICADTETASLQGGVCDLAFAVLDENLNVLHEVESLIDPERPITPEASGVHHITDKDVWAAPTLGEFMEMHQHPFMDDDLVFCAHNAQFDIRMLSEHLPDQFRRVCTLKLARNCWPELADHKLQSLRYRFGLDAGTAHRAMGDVIACVNLLRLIAREKTTDIHGLIQLSRMPLSPNTKMRFGKHKDAKLKDLPSSYVRWLLGTDNLDPDLREALEAL